MTYQFLGKLQPTMYILKHAPGSTPIEGRAPDTVVSDEHEPWRESRN
jgi:hypothetical protein